MDGLEGNLTRPRQVAHAHTWHTKLLGRVGTVSGWRSNPLIERISESTPSPAADAGSRKIPKPPETLAGMRRPAILLLCYSVPGTSFGERNGQHERTAWQAGFSGYPTRFSGRYAVCFAVHFGIQTGSIG